MEFYVPLRAISSVSPPVADGGPCCCGVDCLVGLKRLPPERVPVRLAPVTRPATAGSPARDRVRTLKAMARALRS